MYAFTSSLVATALVGFVAFGGLYVFLTELLSNPAALVATALVAATVTGLTFFGVRGRGTSTTYW